MFAVHVGRASPLARFLRVIWMIVGPTALLALMVVIAWQPGYSIIDVWFPGVVAIVVLARLLDIWKFEGTTSAGEPATSLHFWLYSVKLLVSAAGGWLVAHALHSGQ